MRARSIDLIRAGVFPFPQGTQRSVQIAGRDTRIGQQGVKQLEPQALTGLDDFVDARADEGATGIRHAALGETPTFHRPSNPDGRGARLLRAGGQRLLRVERDLVRVAQVNEEKRRRARRPGPIGGSRPRGAIERVLHDGAGLIGEPELPVHVREMAA